MERNDFVVSDVVDIIVENGIVTIKGNVPNWTVRQAIMSCVENTIGVVDINEEIIIDMPKSEPGMIDSIVQKVRGVTEQTSK